jgi:arylsulfatase A-like enzyme
MKKPNLLFILADDLGWGDLSMHGSPIRTPNIDRLGKEGVEMRQHYVCPMCTPTRASFLTGRYPGRFGAHATVPSNPPVLPDGYETLATILRGNGYDTALFGKWHLGSHPRFAPNGYGFNRSYGSLAGGVDPYNHRYKRGEFSVTWHRDGKLVEETGHVTDLIAREAVEWIESREQPWFCYVPFTAVHVPVKPVHSWLDEYEAGKFDDDPLRDASFKKYAAYTSHMDAAIGKLLQALEVTCQRENTIVVFTSDNGAINDCPIHGTDKYPGWQEASPRLGTNLPYRGVKAQLYEGGIRTPALINWRSHLEPGTIEAPVNVVDWAPTFVGLTGSSPSTDPRWDGLDIWPLIGGDGGGAYPERSFYWNFRRGSQLGFRQGDWKYVSVNRKDPEKMELYNVGEDPYETRELSDEHPDVVRELAGLIREQRELDDTSRRDDVG